MLARMLAEQINLPQDAVMVDATVGQGGHSLLFGHSLGHGGILIGLDVDEKALTYAREKLKGLLCKVILVQANFSQIGQAIRGQGVEKADFILADLGVSSAQLADSEFGLSFQTNMPLDMRIDKRTKITAADIVNKTDERNLADLIYKYGEDRASRRIARFIAEHRRKEKITTTGQLAAIVSRALGQSGQGHRNRIHPATRTFQALRIAVNDELENLRSLLEQMPDLLKKDGFAAVISFHSLEDRMVKLNFKENEKNGFYRIITKKPVEASEQETADNPRARSAKLRIAQRQ